MILLTVIWWADESFAMLSPTDNELDSDKYTTFPSLFIIKIVLMKFSKSAALQHEI